MRVKTLTTYLLLIGLLGLSFFKSADSIEIASSPYEQTKREAEKSYAEGSYRIAHDLYEKIKTAELSAQEKRWVDFRLADTQWRAQAGSQTSDQSQYEQARQQLDKLIRDIKLVEERDLIWAEVQESMGDFWWMRRDQRNWHQALNYYRQALDWWAGSADIEAARKRYLNIVWKMERPQSPEPHYYYGYYGNMVPIDVLENTLKIAKTENDKARANYLIAMTLYRSGGDMYQRSRAVETFEAAIKAGKSSHWYDDALFNYAQWMMQYGRLIEQEDGQYRQEPDYATALSLFKRLVTEHSKGETRYYDQAQESIRQITQPILSVSVPNVFLPDSEVQFHMNWRNVKKVDFTLSKIDLTENLTFSGDRSSGEWLQFVNAGAKVKSWSKEVSIKDDYKPGNEQIRIEDKLPVGAYLLEANSGNARSRELILITDVAIVVKTAPKQSLIYFSNAIDGSPIRQAKIKFWEKHYNEQTNKYSWRSQIKQTNNDGIAVFDLTSPRNSEELFISAIKDNRQAFSNAYSTPYHVNTDQWRIYAFTDRPAYRPKEEVQWKFIARKQNGSVYTTPANQLIEYEITDPRGTKLKEDKVTLNTFGSAWGKFELSETTPLGEYRITFWDKGRRNHIGDATLFRLEEYKLPEYKVSVQTPEENGKKKIFRSGDKVSATIQAEYYFGGPVANASVEVLVYQNPFYRIWQPKRDYAWYYEDIRRPHHYGNGAVIKRETLKTDASGKATITFDTPRNGQEFEYRIEARVTDASRREIVSSQSVKVTRQRYYVNVSPAHNLYRPQDKVTANFKSLDANDNPVAVEGTVKVTRSIWYEIWRDTQGKEIKGDEVKNLRKRQNVKSLNEKGWRLISQGYRHDEILTRKVKTNAEGEAEFSFTPEREGYYRISWVSKDVGSNPVRAETMTWVMNNATTDLGYRHGGLEIIVDKDTLRTGQKAPVMINVPDQDSYVLFSVEGTDLYSYQLVHIPGTVKLIELPIEEKHVPNVFLSAAMVSDTQLFVDNKQVVVPPVRNFLNVEVKSDRKQYQPREEGTLTITTRDHEGKPVSAEVSLGLVDESVFYIQQDYSTDPRQFFYGEKRGQHVQTSSSFQQKSFMYLAKRKADLINERDEGEQLKLEDGRKDYNASGGRMAAQKSMAADSVMTGAVAKRSMVAAEERAMPASAPMPLMAENKASLGKEMQQIAPNVQVRSDFRSTILWKPDLVTDKNGRATIKATYPDSLTSWQTKVRAVSPDNQFGEGNTVTNTKQPLIVRLQAPRFFVAGDQTTISAIINNNTDKPLSVTPDLKSNGLNIIKGSAKPVLVAANGETHVDWIVTSQKSGPAKLKVTAISDKHTDAMEKDYLVHEHGIEKFIAKSGKLRGSEATVKLDIPRERKPESTSLIVQVAPSLAVTMLDALPYLIDYPYGCVEQTMSRFMPAVVTNKTLTNLGLSADDINGKLFGGIEQKSINKTQPKGKKDLRQLDNMVQAGLDRLYDFQHGDGGWGWWKQGDSDVFMSAYVVWGLTLARDADVSVRSDVAERGIQFLNQRLVQKETQPDDQAWMLHALAAHHASTKSKTAHRLQIKAFENLWNQRDQLNAYSRSLLALSAYYYGHTDKAQTLIRNLENGVKRDNSPDTSILQKGGESSNNVMSTAHWGEDGVHWRWSEGGVGATSFALRAMLAVDPQNKLIEPVTNWLIKNRRGAQWNSTLDTAWAVLAMNDYLRVSGELKSDLVYEVVVNDQVIASPKITSANIISAPSKFVINRAQIKDGINEIKIRKKSGSGALYFSAQAEFFSLEEPIKPAGNEIFVRRQYYKLTGKPSLLKGTLYTREPLNDKQTVNSGERIETVITIEAKNNYEYLIFEDLKPAGFEAVAVRSGDSVYAKEMKSTSLERRFSNKPSKADDTDYTGRTRWVYQELRDRKVALFIDKLPQGVWEIRYDMRAEVPGEFHALPTLGYAMYVPEIRSNSAEIRVTVEDK